MKSLQLRFLELGTNLNIAFVINGQPTQDEHKATLYEMLTEFSFLAAGESFYEANKALSGDVYVRISFFRNANMYSFNGKRAELLEKNGMPLVRIDQISAIDESTRRVSPRHEISARVDIYTLAKDRIKQAESGDDSNEEIYSGQIFDISNEGLCVLSNVRLEIASGAVVIVDFLLNKTERFTIPAKLIRSGNSPQSVQYKFDYAFLFDFTNKPEERTRLNTSIFKHKTLARRQQI